MMCDLTQQIMSIDCDNRVNCDNDMNEHTENDSIDLHENVHINDYVSVFVNHVINSHIKLNTSLDSNDITFPRLFDTNGRPLILQPSLFPHVTPTVYFSSVNDTLTIPDELRRFLKWKLSSITPNTIKSVVSHSGFQLIKDKKNAMKWSAIWCKHMKSHEFKSIREYQKVNHFPGSFHLGRKDKLWLNLKSMSVKHGYEVFGEFHPQTFILPHDLKLLKKFWMNSDDEKWFILKPPASARGQGISVINRYSQIPQNAKVKRQHSNKSTLIVQNYISNPCLLFNGTKFDLRVYVLMTSVVPLRLYVFNDGIVRFASVKYSNDSNNLNDQFIHLTNYSVNKNNLNYVSNNDINGHCGNKWTLKALWNYMSQTCRGLDVENLWNSIVDMIIKTIISCESHVHKLVRQNLRNRYTSFELLGFDIMLDDHYKPWLLEVNISPSLRSDSSLDNTVKSQLIKDMFNIVGYHLPPNAYRITPDAKEICFNKHLYSTHLSEEEKLKHRHFENLMITDEMNERNIDEMFMTLTGDDIRELIKSEDELSRCGNFSRIFPTFTSNQYFQYFDYVFYYDLLLDCWEQRYYNDRINGIIFLRKFCNHNEHLNRNDQDQLNDISDEQQLDMREDKTNERRNEKPQAMDILSNGRHIELIPR